MWRHLAGILFCALAVGIVPQTPPPLPAFDAVTVKPFVPTGPWHRIPQFDPQRLYLEGSSPLEMIVYAYGINYNQVDRLPDWTQRQYFQVIGVTDKPASKNQMLLMLQRVLAERFQFAFTDTDAVQPVDALVVSPGGLKMKPSTSDSDCGHGVISFDRIKAAHLPPDAMVPFAGCTVAELLKGLNLRRRLSGQVPIIDKTGLTGQYSMLVWSRHDGCHQLPGGGMHCDINESMEDAVKRELGLELVRTTAPYRVLHTTRIAPPTANN
ncbi:MAG: TIGR03435 family protein [Terriglobales bacterium]